ncbi:MAG: 4Fe-4S dicluster domain-containing protein [Lentimicrobiaceae bacterium]|jgi:Fe-S oxidoreductase|nr:4Fe-4S dicluster domain-containing protein [Lentimicrobiaceae bacterium]MBT3455365.1 4Fe-4S dicluster domain-containing protein [Lentimicrobiaceae bacterium]MBT3818795.1 4Fe-4S dicluster domain-containing protein [Lentimicrobiaceae bacterium]MBT4062062.1 4Fe-4S dicluster domain-containing protein [Lentimicrobiaceae bacterium]MBT4190806.1 4Fe-4S dicluster domain-containing protein [Lentimicrobiaceae bacterium]
MLNQLIFLIVLLITLGVFAYSTSKYVKYFKFTKKKSLSDFGKRIWVTIKVAFLQTKILRRPVVGSMHALVWWGFILILFGSLEMVFDGLFGTERVFSFMGPLYDFVMAAGDIAAFAITILILAFLFRRVFMHIKRFYGPEMKPVSKMDANLALTIILMLMITLLGMNVYYILWCESTGTIIHGSYPVSKLIAALFNSSPAYNLWTVYQINWWAHILWIFIFANILPYSKHFHVFMSVPNVFFSDMKPMGYVENMESITKEVKLMMDPDAAFEDDPEADESEPERFGVKDVEDLNWINYFNSLACTECGRCTSSCPANITGKLLSPRKIMMGTRARMKEKGPGLVAEGNSFDDGKSLVTTFITEEELWACTQCNACVQECPVNINPASLILDMRRYQVMEESKAPTGLNTVFQNIENNGAPWQFSQDDRMLWAEDLNVPLMSDGKNPDYLFWIGSAGAFDDRYKKVTREFIKILNHVGIDYAVLGTEESDSGDVARRSGNEMLFQMQAMMNVEILNGYDVKNIITCDPHDFNTIKNEYPDFGGNYNVYHHSQFLQELIDNGKINLDGKEFADKKITFHDPCYLGRGNGEYDAPRSVLDAMPVKNVEMKRNKSFSLCCGAGGGQMFKEAEKGDKEVFMERTEEAISTGCDIIATACPFCMVMMTDGLKYKNKDEEIKNYDIAELVSASLNI